MSTAAQKAAQQRAKDLFNQRKSEEKKARNNYNQSRTNYSNLAKSGYKQSANTKVQYSNYNNATKAAKSILDGVTVKNKDGSLSIDADKIYEKKYTDRIESLLDQAENGKMNYSVTDDPAYKVLENTYVNNGKKAMQNAIGETVASTGGYGSTAALAAGQAAYNENLTNLNAEVSDLYNAAAQRFNEHQNLLVNLADSYNNMDQQNWENSYNTWNSTFNNYMNLADEYLKAYEYLDDADRRDYETRLDAYYNLLTSDQSQYQNAQGNTQNAFTGYNDVVQANANYDETVRANKANEALAAAQFREQQRQFNAQQQTNNTTSSGSNTTDSKGTSVQLPTGLLQEVGMCRTDPGKRNKINNLYKNGSITANQKKALIKHFNL